MMNIVKHKGFTLIEMMIAILIGTLVVAATIAIYVSAIRGSSNTLKSTQLNQDLGLAMTIMTNDIRRAGYWGGAVIGSDSRNNPFMVAGSTNLEVNGSCITYTYDANHDGVVDANEYYGFRLHNGTIEMKDSGSTTNACNDPQAVWSDMLDSKRIKVTQLNFDLSRSKCYNKTTKTASSGLCSLSSGQTGVEVRNVGINLKAEVENDSTIHVEFSNAGYSSTVTVRNNRIYTEP